MGGGFGELPKKEVQKHEKNDESMHYIKEQHPSQVIDIQKWNPDESYYEGFFPQGARVKKAVFSDYISPYPFIKPNFRYLFKESFERYPDQFWAEIIAYKVACAMKIYAPPTFVATDGEKTGALIEWFYDENSPCFLRYIEGSAFFGDIIPDFDYEKGKQHNLKTIFQIFNLFRIDQRFELQTDWLKQFVCTLLFDSIIGNTDRHQDNWGLMVCRSENSKQKIRMAPAFDNGTSLGHEILPQNFDKFNNPIFLQKYLKRGTHHLRLTIDAKARISHFDLVEILKKSCLQILSEQLRILDLDRLLLQLLELSEFKVPTPISKDRLLFAYMLIKERYLEITDIINK